MSGIAGKNLVMAQTHLLHAFAPASGGLELWAEIVQGHAVITDPSELSAADLPPALLDIIQSRPARSRGDRTLATPRGQLVSMAVPTLAFVPEDAVGVMVRLCRYVNDHGSEGLSGELLYLCDLFAFADSLVRNGRIMFRADRIDQEWLPRWIRSTAGDHHQECQKFVEALPGVLEFNGTQVPELVDDFIHWLTVRYLTDNKALEREKSGDFVHALMTGQPTRRVSPQTVEYLNEWRLSAAREATELTLILSSPDDALDRNGADVDKEVDVALVRWRLDLAISVNKGPVERLVASETSEATRDLVLSMINRLVKVWPDMKTTMHAVQLWCHRGVWFPEDNILTGNAYRDRIVGVGLTADSVAVLLDHKAAELRERGINVMIPRSWTRIRPNVHVKAAAVGQGPGSGKMGLDQIMNFEVDVSMDGATLDKREAERLLKSASSIVNINGQYVHLDQDALRRARAWFQGLTESGDDDEIAQNVTLRDILEANAAAELDADDEHGFYVQTDGWARHILETDNEVDPVEAVDIPDTILTPLRDHQRRGLNWLAWMFQHRLGALLADDMGLGKTLQVLALLAWERAVGEHTGPTLVIAPTSVLDAWRNEAARHVPSLNVVVDHGAKVAETLEWGRALGESAPDLIVTSYGRVARNPERYRAVPWGRVVADEAQAIKNPNTKQSKAVRSIYADHYVALTGTPVENRLSDLYALMDFSNPGILGSAPAFQNRLAIPIERYQDPHATARLKAIVQPFILRRLKTDESVGLDLPPKQEIIEYVKLTAEQATLYKAYIDSLEAELHKPMRGRRALVLAALTRIKQICNHPAHFAQDGSGLMLDGQHRSERVRRTFEILEQARKNGRKALIFTQFPSFGKILIPELEKHFGMDVPMLYGELSQKKRGALVESFQSPDGPPIMILSVKAGGTGITLTEASVVIHIDRWWNPAVEDQATDRAYRIGQNRDVTVYKLVAKGTLDERINDVILGKRELAGNVVGAGEGWIADLSDAELSELWTLQQSSEESAQDQGKR